MTTRSGVEIKQFEASQRQFALLTLTPDFFWHGSSRRLLSWVSEIGAQVVIAVSLDYSAFDVSLIYRQTEAEGSRKRTPDTTWLSRSLFTLGRSLVLVLSRDRDEGCFQSEISLMKGSSDPQERGSHGLRSMSPIADRCLSLIHCPDDDSAFQNEMSLIFGEYRSRAILAELRMRAAELAIQPEVLEWAINSQSKEKMSALIRRRILAVFLCDAMFDCRLPTKAVDDDLNNFFDEVISHVRSQYKSSPLSDRNDGRLELSAEARNLLLSASEALESSSLPSPAQASRLIKILRLNAIQVDRYEEHAFNAECVFS